MAGCKDMLNPQTHIDSNGLTPVGAQSTHWRFRFQDFIVWSSWVVWSLTTNMQVQNLIPPSLCFLFILTDSHTLCDFRRFCCFPIAVEA